MSTKKKVASRRKLVVCIVAVVMILGAGGVVAWISLRPAVKPQKATETKSSGIANRPVGDIEKDIAATSDAAKKAGLYGELVSAQQRDGNEDAALDASLKAIQAKESASAYGVAGLLYMNRGDKAKAIEYFKKAMTLSEPTSDPQLNSSYNNYKAYIRELGGDV